MCKLGKSGSVTLVAFPKGKALPSFVKIDQMTFKLHPYIPQPMRCNKCQIFGHRAKSCKRETVCSRCTGKHDYISCNNQFKCVNCSQEHSSAYRKCPKYLQLQAALKLREEQHIPLALALQKVNELNPSPAIPLDHSDHSDHHLSEQPITTVITKPSYASKVKVGGMDQVELPSLVSPPETNFIANQPYVATASLPEVNSEQQEIINSFLKVDAGKFKIIDNRNTQNKIDTPILNTNKAFILGVLTVIDQAETKEQAVNVIRLVASQLFFNGKVEFHRKGQ